MITIRPFQSEDLLPLVALNTASAPAVNVLKPEQMAEQCANAEHALVAHDGTKPVAMLLCFIEGQTYGSKNYKWLSERLERFAYVDRIFVHSDMRGQNIGEKLYAHLMEQPALADRPLTCEVNTRPANPGSLRFHKRLGFNEIGTADNGDYAVVYLQKDPVETSRA